MLRLRRLLRPNPRTLQQIRTGRGMLDSPQRRIHVLLASAGTSTNCPRCPLLNLLNLGFHPHRPQTPRRKQTKRPNGPPRRSLPNQQIRTIRRMAQGNFRIRNKTKLKYIKLNYRREEKNQNLINYPLIVITTLVNQMNNQHQNQNQKEQELEHSEIEFERPFSTDSSPNSHEGISKIQAAGLAPLNFRSQRRGSVSAESYQPLRRQSTHNNTHNSPNTHNNTNTHNNLNTHNNTVLEAVKNNFLFRSLDPEQLEMVLAALKERSVNKDEVVITQGEEGDNFYIVEEGKFAVEIDGSEVVQIGPKGSFGELALMYNSPRAASVKALEKGKLFALDRITFRRVIIDLAHEKRCKYIAFLSSLPLLAQTLAESEIARVADALEEISFAQSNEHVITQGDPGDAFYIVLSGIAHVIKDDIHVATLNPGDYFGELALLNNQPRAASVIVKEAPLKCLRLNQVDFVRLLGPLKDLLKRNEEQYNQYKQFILE